MIEVSIGPAPVFLRAVEGRSAPFVVTLIVALSVVIGYVDYRTGWESSFSVFYLLPVALGTWRFGVAGALVTAVLSGLAWLLADQLAGHGYSQPWIPYWNAVARMGVFLVLGVTLAALKETLRRAHELARVDVLTGVPNLRALREQLSYHLNVIPRHHDPVSLAMIDLDHFKEVNDTYGHATGDKALRVVAKVLTHNVRKVDLTARIGGDEFVVLLPRTGEEGARDALEKVRTAIEAVMADHGWPITASIGASTCRGQFAADECLRESDKMLYQAKAEGGNRVVVGPIQLPEPGVPHYARMR